MKKILAGMSGGVDSSAAAIILMRQGYGVTGCTLKLLPDEMGGNEEDIESARDVCKKLGIEHMVLDLSDSFREKVMSAFAESYIRGETPNPCIVCNKHIKFGAMLDKALEMGFDGIATGHYADIRYSGSDGRYLLMRPLDRKKDQTYMLCGLTQFQLSHTLLPLCDMDKQTVRELAAESGLDCAHRKDSQDICFVRDGDYAGFIERFTGRTFPAGDYIDEKGNILGKHRGYIHYTIGQRKGLGIALGEPVRVCAKDPENNTVTLTRNDVFCETVTAGNVNFISVPEIKGEMPVTAKVRHNMQPAEGILTALPGGKIQVRFTPVYTSSGGKNALDTSRAVIAPAKGQSLVVYDYDTVICGGVIEEHSCF